MNPHDKFRYILFDFLGGFHYSHSVHFLFETQTAPGGFPDLEDFAMETSDLEEPFDLGDGTEVGDEADSSDPVSCYNEI